MHDTISTDEFSFQLLPSAIEGVGVFAKHDIQKGTPLHFFSSEKERFIPYSQAQQDEEYKKDLYERYCIDGKDGYYCPKNFAQMDIGWYLNHSSQPNAYHKNYDYYALVDIKKGEEIVISYDSLDND